MPVDREELELVWPADLFAREGERILSAHGSPEHRYQRLDALMAEAFHGDRGTKLLTEVHQQRPPVPPDASVPGPGHDIIEIWESPPPPPPSLRNHPRAPHLRLVVSQDLPARGAEEAPRRERRADPLHFDAGDVVRRLFAFVGFDGANGDDETRIA